MRAVVNRIGLLLNVGNRPAGRGVVSGTRQINQCRAGVGRIKEGIARRNRNIESDIAGYCEIEIVIDKLPPAVNPIGKVARISQIRGLIGDGVADKAGAGTVCARWRSERIAIGSGSKTHQIKSGSAPE